MEVEGDDGFDTPRGACGCVGGNSACGCGYVGGPCGCVGGNGVGNASGCVGGNGARGCGSAADVAALEATWPVAAEAVARRCLATIFANSLARSSVRVCSNASLIRPICLRETVLPSTHRSRRLTAKDRKEARHPLQVNHFLYPCTGRGVPTPRATLLPRRRGLAPSEGISRSL